MTEVRLIEANIIEMRTSGLHVKSNIKPFSHAVYAEAPTGCYGGEWQFDTFHLTILNHENSSWEGTDAIKMQKIYLDRIRKVLRFIVN